MIEVKNGSQSYKFPHDVIVLQEQIKELQRKHDLLIAAIEHIAAILSKVINTNIVWQK